MTIAFKGSHFERDVILWAGMLHTVAKEKACPSSSLKELNQHYLRPIQLGDIRMNNPQFVV
jgi:hypothetical protein